MKTYVGPGDVLKLIAPSGGVSSGVPLGVGPALEKLVVVPAADAVENDYYAGQAEGEFELTKQAVDDFVAGESVFWDDTNNRVEKTAVGMIPMGVCTETTAASAVVVKVKLSGQPGTIVT